MRAERAGMQGGQRTARDKEERGGDEGAFLANIPDVDLLRRRKNDLRSLIVHFQEIDAPNTLLTDFSG